VLQGDTAMNCSLCKYRSEVLGFENEVGLAQQSHHHHVEGLTDSCSLCENECTGDCQPDGKVVLPKGNDHHHADAHLHDHSHGHYPYPHAEHPLGPVSLRKPLADES
ncbi:MAG TPA: sirohydrochlorin chelatase, partial [Prochlorococcaceae cyanobacterium Fu_MAG_134]|nr:sirohydrochlorin chelatase [Prochlorococcaceae cyanobacterium Fu_MAG_134]